MMSGSSSALKLNLIAACDAKLGIGVKNDLPWRLRKEMTYFNRMTTGIRIKDPGCQKRNVVVMGRKTYDSIPEKFRPMKNRLNVVLSRGKIDMPEHKDLVSCGSWEDAMKFLSKPEMQEETDQVWVIGGSHIYKLALESPFCHRIYLTRLAKEFECDTFFPEFDESKFQLVRDPEVPEGVQEEGDIQYKFHVYEKV